jgi:hypothetical protein
MAWLRAGWGSQRRLPGRGPRPRARTLRRALWARPQDTGPHPRHPPPASPTVRWGFPRLDSLHRVQRTRPGQVQTRIDGLTALQINGLRRCGAAVGALEHMSSG